MSINSISSKGIQPTKEELIAKYEGYRDTAIKVGDISLKIIASSLIATALFLASPILPFSLVILVPFVVIIGIFMALLAGKSAPHTSMEGEKAFAKGFMALWGATAGFGIKTGVSWVKKIYSTEMIKRASFGNLAIIAPALLVGAGAGLTYLWCNKKIENLKNS